MSEVAEMAADIAADVVEESVDGVVEVMEVVRNNPVSLALVGAAGLVVGGVAGYFFAKKKLTEFYEEQIQLEIAEAKEFYAGVYKTSADGTPLSPGEVLAQRHGEEALLRYQGREVVEDISDEELDEIQIQKIESARVVDTSVDEKDIRNVFEENRNLTVDPKFDLEEELARRDPTRPYVISHDEYYEAERNYDNSSLTYYEADDVLANERDEPQNEIDKVVGDEALGRFGHGSKDPNIVYVRNDRLQMDFEVVRSTGSYLKEVLGIDPDEDNSLRHSNSRDRRRAFRHGDD